MGRRTDRLEYHGNTLTSREHFIYKGYVQIAAYKLDAEGQSGDCFVLSKSCYWDPSQPTATRILAMKDASDATMLYAACDTVKNITALYDDAGTCRARYVYSPYGEKLIEEGDKHTANAFGFSSEYDDSPLGLYYYNYRYLNPNDGRWINRDPIAEQGGINLYVFIKNNLLKNIDNIGLWRSSTHESLTKSALKDLWESLEPPSVHTHKWKVRIKTINQIVEHNINTDSGALGKDQSYHYCWSYKRDTSGQADEKYEKTLENVKEALKKDMDKIDPANPLRTICDKALKNIGILTHMWQDYYAHGVKSDSGGKAEVGEISGNPNSRDMVPVSWGGYHDTAGHGWTEPGDRATDVVKRRNGSVDFTRDNIIEYLSEWLSKCRCESNNKKIFLSK